MLQPFVLLEKKYLPKLIELKKVYLVTQSYARGFNHFDTERRIPILVTDYDNPGLANIHFNAVKGDKYASIIRLDIEEHRKKLLEMLSGVKYGIYWSFVQSSSDMKKRLQASYSDKFRKYIDFKTDWRIKGDETVNVEGLEVTFGELFVTLKWRTQKLRIKFEDIEKL